MRALDEFCRIKGCENYIEWEHEVLMEDWNISHHSVMICVSCTKVGQSYNIDEYPEDCPHLKEISSFKWFKEQRAIALAAIKEKEKTWITISK
jgi:hypothetical protein